MHIRDLQRERHINGRFDGLTQAVVPRVRHHADDLQPAIAVRHRLRERRLGLNIG